MKAIPIVTSRLCSYRLTRCNLLAVSVATLDRSTYAPRLPQVPSLVSRDDMKAGGKTEPDATHERIWKVYSGQIKVAVRT